MTLFDTHTHLYLPEFDSDRPEMMRRALEAGVARMMLPNVDLSTIGQMRRLHSDYPEQTIMAMGLHPTEIGLGWRETLGIVHDELCASPLDYKAVGEVGIDLYWDTTHREAQMEAFAEQIGWALELNLPVIIHCREGLDETLEVLASFSDKPRAVFHSFGGSADDVERILNAGDYYFGINGIVTFKNSHLRETLPAIPADRLLLETDAPYLAPVPYRGKRNESAYMIQTAGAVAASLGKDIEEIAGLTTRNAEIFFSIAD